MRYRMIALDMDDTLLGSDLKISPDTVDRIRQAKEKGVQIVIATGRMFRAIIPYLQELNLEVDPVIVYNGAMVKRLSDSKPMVHHPIPVDLAREVANCIERAGSQVNVYLDDQLFVRAKTPEVLRYMKKTRVDSTEVGPIGEFFNEGFAGQGPTKMLVIHYDLTEIDQLRKDIQDKFGDILTITGSKPYFIEITKRGISKGYALAELAKISGYTAEQVIAIGDGLNDLSMVKWAGLGVAVANAHPDLQKAANYVTSSCDEEGVTQVIDKFILHRG